jgi:hypothetical protein
MNWPNTPVAVIVALLLGVAIGTLGGYRYAEYRVGGEVLEMLRRDASTTLKTYKRIRELAQSNDGERLLKYIDGAIDTETAALKATQSSESGGPNPR